MKKAAKFFHGTKPLNLSRMKFLAVVFCSIVALFAHGANIEVCPSCEIKSLRDALKVSQPFDVINIKSGVYIDHAIELTMPLTLIGEKGSVLDGGDQGEILTLHADSIIIKGLTFRNVGLSYTKDWAGISSDRVKGCRIENNTFEKTFFGIYLRKSEDCVVSGNYMDGEAEQEMTSGNGIHFWYCKNMLVENNQVLRHRDGIYFEFVKHSIVKNNLSKNRMNGRF